jgi:hypothetical protein
MVRKYKKISYPQKYAELIKRHGEVNGIIEYGKFLRIFSLEKCILKFGEVQGTLDYEKKRNNIKNSGVTLNKMILKYGDENGRKKYQNWKDTTRQSLDSFIMRYGETEGLNKYNIFKEKSLIPLSKVDRSKVKNARKLEYWIEKCGDVETAKRELSKFQNNSSLDKFIGKYGDVEGKERYLESCRKRINNLESFIRRYGFVDGSEKYESYINKLKQVRSSEYIKNKHGVAYYEELIKKKTNNFGDRYSKIGLEFCLGVVKKLNNEHEKVYYGKNEYVFYVDNKNFKLISPDLYIKDINVVVEFYGDFWHRNPEKYETIDDEFKVGIWEHDKNRVNILREKFGCQVIIVWEGDYINNKEKIILETINKINKYG